ncbi:unnamed protein product, partial [Rotaria sp. Silwood2]
SLQTDFLHSTSCVLCPSNTPITLPPRSISSSSSSISTSPARPSTIVIDEPKRQLTKPKEKTVHHTRSSFLRLRQAQQNKLLSQQDKRL